MPYRIFVVEDHPIMRKAYADVLGREETLELCGTAESAEQALIALESTPCDLIVVDVSLPGMDGLDLAERLLALKPELPVLIISAHDERTISERIHQVGARAFLSKKNLVDTLAGTIFQVLQDGTRGNEMDPTISPL